MWWFECFGQQSDTIRRCDLVGVGMALLKEACVTVGQDFEMFLLVMWEPSDQDVEFSAPPEPCLTGCWHPLCLGDHELNH